MTLHQRALEAAEYARSELHVDIVMASPDERHVIFVCGPDCLALYGNVVIKPSDKLEVVGSPTIVIRSLFDGAELDVSI